LLPELPLPELLLPALPLPELLLPELPLLPLLELPLRARPRSFPEFDLPCLTSLGELPVAPLFVELPAGF